MQFEVETTQVASAVRKMQNVLDGITEGRERMYGAMETLDSMWTGEAHDAFRSQFSSDDQMLAQLITEVQDIIDKFDQARQEYDNCEQSTKDIVSAVAI